MWSCRVGRWRTSGPCRSVSSGGDFSHIEIILFRVVCISDGPTEEGGPGILARLVSALPGSQEVSGTDGKDVSSHEVNGADFKSAEIPVKKKKRKELSRKDIDTQKLKEVKLDKIKENPGKVTLKDVSKEVKVDKVKIKKNEKVKAKKLGTVNVKVEMTEDVSATNMESSIKKGDQTNHREEVMGVKTDSSSSFTCTICSKVWKSKGSLKRHARINHKGDIVASEAIRGDDGKFWCTLCPHNSEIKGSMKKHLYGRHNLGPGYDCPKCGEKFKLKQHVVRHMSRKVCEDRLHAREERGQEHEPQRKCKAKGVAMDIGSP